LRSRPAGDSILVIGQATRERNRAHQLRTGGRRRRCRFCRRRQSKSDPTSRRSTA
jgi:hypothetical protein